MKRLSTAGVCKLATSRRDLADDAARRLAVSELTIDLLNQREDVTFTPTELEAVGLVLEAELSAAAKADQTASALQAVLHKLEDGTPDDLPGYPGDAAADWFGENVLKPLTALVCAHLGHTVVKDHCLEPAHDYCTRCQEKRPGEAPGRRKS
jgi:hypothetical protein